MRLSKILNGMENVQYNINFLKVVFKLMYSRISTLLFFESMRKRKIIKKDLKMLTAAVYCK